MSIIKEIIYDYGRLVPYGMTLVLYLTFFTAFLSENKAVLVKIDTYGEAFIEAVFLMVALPIMAYSLIRELKTKKQKKKQVKWSGWYPWDWGEGN